MSLLLISQSARTEVDLQPSRLLSGILKASESCWANQCGHRIDTTQKEIRHRLADTGRNATRRGWFGDRSLELKSTPQNYWTPKIWNYEWFAYLNRWYMCYKSCLLLYRFITFTVLWFVICAQLVLIHCWWLISKSDQHTISVAYKFNYGMPLSALIPFKMIYQ